MASWLVRVCWASSSRSLSAARVSQAVATSATRLICVLRRVSRQRQVVFQRLVPQVAYPAKHVQFITAQAQLRTVIVGGGRRAGAGQRPWRAAVGAADAGIDGGKQVRALDAVLRLGLFDIQAGQAQVAVIGQRQRLQLCQAAVGKELLPFDIGPHLPFRQADRRQPLRGNRRFRPLILAVPG